MKVGESRNLVDVTRRRVDSVTLSIVACAFAVTNSKPLYFRAI